MSCAFSAAAAENFAARLAAIWIVSPVAGFRSALELPEAFTDPREQQERPF